MPAAFAELEARMTAAVHARLDNVVVTPASGGQPFTAQFDAADRSAFDSALVGDYTLRYLLADAALAAGHELAIGGVTYQVADTPQRLNAFEGLAQLVIGAGDPAPEPEEGG